MLAGAAGMYFAMSDIVCAIFSVIAICICLLGFIFRRRGIATLALCFLFGFGYAYTFTHIIATPRIYRPARGADISGTVTDIDYTTGATRISVSVPGAQLNKKITKSATVRVNIDPETDVKIGDEIVARANLFPPSGAEIPDGFDYARMAYMTGLAATGFVTNIKVISTDDAGGIRAVRDALHKHANSFLSDTLILGYKGALPKPDRITWTTIGIGHVWSISGFHMTLVGGWLFFLFYNIFRLFPYITRRIPARIPATICAWFGLVGYLMISGMGVAAMRAFLMATLAFVAIIIGRSAISMRNVAIAFCIIFLINPHYVMQPGFQLSFAAIFGLIWFWGGRPGKYYKSIIRKFGRWVYVAILTTFVATIFTLPFVAAHFAQFPTYSLLGNLFWVPLFSFVIMPLVFIGTFTAAIGFGAPLHIADAIYAWCLKYAEQVASLPYANITMPHISNAAMCIIIFGFLCVMFIRTAHDAYPRIMRHINYVIGGIFITGGIFIIALTPRPMFYVTVDATLAAFKYGDHLEFTSKKLSAHKFTFDTWRVRNGEAADIPNIRRKPEKGVWMYRTPKFSVAYIPRFVPLAREIIGMCNDNSVDYIVSYFDIDAPKCAHKILRGGFVIYPSGRVQMMSPTRPWNKMP